MPRAFAAVVFRLVSAALMAAGGFLAALAGASLHERASGTVSCMCSPSHVADHASDRAQKGVLP
jgi:hypothetical protein